MVDIQCDEQNRQNTAPAPIVATIYPFMSGNRAFVRCASGKRNYLAILFLIEW